MLALNRFTRLNRLNRFMSCSEKKSGESRGTLTHLKSALNATFYCKFLRPLFVTEAAIESVL